MSTATTGNQQAQTVKTIITGRLTDNLTIELTPNGKEVSKFSVAVNYGYENKKTRKRVEKVKYYEVQVWAEVATKLAEKAKKGDEVELFCLASPNSYFSDKKQERVNETILTVKRFNLKRKAKANQ